jgi:hypothetical protein
MGTPDASVDGCQNRSGCGAFPYPTSSYDGSQRGSQWLPLAARGSLLAVDEPQCLGRRDDGDALEGFEGE